MKKELKFGFDIGETSLGWSVLDSQTNEIVALGVRAWDKSEDRKGRGLNEIRTEKSNVRKTLRRRKHRKDRVKNLSFKAQYPILRVAGWGCKPKPIGLITFRF